MSLTFVASGRYLPLYKQGLVQKCKTPVTNWTSSFVPNRAASTAIGLNQSENKHTCWRMTSSTVGGNGSAELTVGFFGGGMMAEAIIRGMLTNKVVAPDNVIVSDPSEERRNALAPLKVKTTSDPVEMQASSKVIFVAVKPDIVPYLFKDMKAHEGTVDDAPLFISVALGLTVDYLLDGNSDRKMVRVMPNQPCLVGEGVCAFSMSKACGEADRQVVNTLLGACGLVVEVPEKKLDAVTGVSGSGPAYVYMMIEAMADAGVMHGLPRNVAVQLAAQTALGSAKMVLEDLDAHPAELRNRVESPGGATIAASCALEHAGFRAALIDAVTTVVKRAQEFGGK